MKFKTDHNVYAPTFEVLAELLDKDYEIKHDNSDDALGISATVVHKEYKTHGIHIKTNLGPNPEWKLGAYVNLPLEMVGLPYHIFVSEEKENGFPKLSDTQIDDIRRKIKEIDKRTIMDIKTLGKDIDVGGIGISSKELNFYQEGGLDLSSFENYGIDINYEKFLLEPFKKMSDNYKLIKTVINASDSKVRDLTEKVINLYLTEIRFKNPDNGLQAVKRFTPEVVKKFTTANKDFYIATVKSYFDLKNIDIKTEGPMIDTFVKELGDLYIEEEIYSWAYNGTGDDHFVSGAAKDLFLF